MISIPIIKPPKSLLLEESFIAHSYLPYRPRDLHLPTLTRVESTKTLEWPFSQLIFEIESDRRALHPEDEGVKEWQSTERVQCACSARRVLMCLSIFTVSTATLVPPSSHPLSSIHPFPFPVPISFAESRSCARLQPNAAIHQMEVKLAPFAISSWEGGSAQCTRRY